VLVFSHMPTRAELNYNKVDNIMYGQEVETALQTHVTNGGEVIGFVYGHTHGDSAKVVSGCTFPFISIACNSPYKIGNNLLPLGSVAPARKIRTLTEDCWDVLTLRRDERKIYLTRFGAGDDRIVDY
jgi:hypothetical protein